MSSITATSTRNNITIASYGDLPIVVKKYSTHERFYAESKMLARLDSPFIVKPIGIISNEHKLAIEYMVNGDLHAFLQKIEYPLSLLPQARAYIAWCVAKGLADLHTRGIEHQKLTIKRVLLSDNMDVKICGLYGAAFVPKTLEDFGAVDILAFGKILQELLAAPKGYEPHEDDEIPITPAWLQDMALRCVLVDPNARPSIISIVKVLEENHANEGLLYHGLHHETSLSIFKFTLTVTPKPIVDFKDIENRIKALEPMNPKVVPIEKIPHLDPAKLVHEGTYVASSESVTQFQGKYDDRPVIIHQLHKHVSPREQELLTTHIEARAGLDSPCVDKLLGLCEVNDLACMVVEGTSTTTLRDLLIRSRPYMGEFIWHCKLQCARDIMDGVKYLHSQGILHYNLSTMAVLIDQATHKIKLTDFGYSKMTQSNETLTLGTGGCRWSAPEVIRHSGMESVYSDVFAFGVLLSELETHQVPYYETKNDTAAQQRIAKGDLPAFTSTCPLWYSQLAQDCMHLDPFQRPTPADIIARIEAHLHGSGFDINSGPAVINQLDATRLEFGKYIGGGIFSNGYLGLYDKQPIVLKRPNNHSNSTEYDRPTYFFREVSMYIRVPSPFLVQMLGVAQVPSSAPALILENMDLGSLASYIMTISDPDTFHEATRLHIAFSAAQALAHMHEAQCVHCDVKSDNIYLNSKLCAKLSMLAVAQYLENPNEGAETLPLAGTLLWMAPEIMKGDRYTLKSDVYSFGVVLTEINTLQRPFSSTILSRYTLPQKVATGELRPELRSDCPSWYSDIANACLAFNPADRPSMEKVVEQFRKKIVELGDDFNPDFSNVSIEVPSLNIAGLLDSVQKVNQEDVTVSTCVLGRGAYGTVIWGTYQNKAVAIKQLHSATLKDRHKLQKFLRELDIMTRFRSPFIVECFGMCDLAAAGPVLLMEYMNKGDLRRYLDGLRSRQDALPWSTRCEMAHALIQAIALLHEMNIAHRDIKSYNLLLNEELELKVGDFGEAHPMSEIVYDDLMEDIGTVLWMAPELFTGNIRDTSKTDIYSFGVVLSELDSLQRPFASKEMTVFAIEHAVAKGDLRPEISTNAPEWYRELAEACLSYDPDKRPTANSIVARFQKRMLGSM
ncbi:serine/threonineprotein kinase [Thraustotheca clavata]|uniref:Serine/threonineprotein kinase n=1 Tax=Thraustotheca clavata TaxID=74557 RepID=A0A1W0AB18_9STRA|nr:serine/threonineprotein kinase [Thraustotheca clavata]